MAVYLDGTGGQHLSLSSANHPGTGISFTILFWAYFNSFPTSSGNGQNRNIFWNTNNSDFDALLLGHLLGGDGQLLFATLLNGAPSQQDITLTPKLATKRPYHFAAVYNLGANAKLYVNADLRSTLIDASSLTMDDYALGGPNFGGDLVMDG